LVVGHHIEAQTKEVTYNLFDYFKQILPKLYPNKNSVIDTVCNEDIYEEIEKATKIKKSDS
jgi:hypothetical protein